MNSEQQQLGLLVLDRFIPFVTYECYMLRVEYKIADDSDEYCMLSGMTVINVSLCSVMPVGRTHTCIACPV